MAVSKKHLDRRERSFEKGIDLFARLRECVTEEDVEKFYVKLMKGVEASREEKEIILPHHEAMKMFFKLIVPEKESVETPNDAAKLPKLPQGAEDELRKIFERYSRKKVENVVATVEPGKDQGDVRQGGRAEDGARPPQVGDDNGVEGQGDAEPNA